MKKEDEKVQETISKSDNAAEILTEAKDIAFDNAVSLFGPLQTLKELSEFLQDIIKIENNFNELYKTMKSSQEAARQKYAQNMTKYENSKVHIQNEGVDSFEKLIFRALIHVSTFNQLLNKIEAKCNANNIKLSNSGAQCKGMERAFYKTYYIYGNNDGYKQIKDVLRASLIFDSFDDLYKAFGIIDQMCPILRVKDRFNPKVMPFGYRYCSLYFLFHFI